MKKIANVKTRTVELTLRVSYCHGEDWIERVDKTNEQPDLDVCKGQLEDLVKLAVNRGLLTNETDMVVADYYSHVDEVTE